MDPITVLMTGCGAPGAHGILKCLSNSGRKFRVVGVDMNENAGCRDMVDAFATVPAAADEGFIGAVLDICRREGVQVVLPIVTRELMKFAQARPRFEAIGAKVAVMEPETLAIVNNKARLLTAMEEAGLPVPAFRLARTVAELEEACARLGWPEKPLCVKASVGNGSRGVRMLDASVSRYDLFFNSKPNSMYIGYDELLRTLSERPEIPEMLVMEFLPGTEYSVDFLADHGRPLYTVCRRGLSVVTSNMMSLVVERNDEAEGLCRRVVETLGMDGNFGFDLLRGADGRAYVIECNPRLTAGVVACAAAGINLPYLGVCRLLGEELPPAEPRYGTRMSRRYEESFTDAQGRPIPW